jgi:hypothetical protein
MSKQIPSGLARPLGRKRLCSAKFMLQKALAISYDGFSIGGCTPEWTPGLDAGPVAYLTVENVMYGL